jgi:SAM-dependent methyltransferase
MPLAAAGMVASADVTLPSPGRIARTTVYDRIGVGYSSARRPDPRWAAAIREAVGAATSVVNIGAGTGAYEPTDLRVVAVEPSAVMRAQRAGDAAECLAGRAEQLPLCSGSFDVAMAVLTIHHWVDLDAGIREMLRVAERFVVVTYDMEVQANYWFTRDYVPEIASAERSRVPPVRRLVGLFGGCRVQKLPVWHDFTDGFMTAFWRRPHAYLDPDRRRACSAFALTDAAAVERGVAKLRTDLQSGAWMRTYGHLLARDRIDAGFRMLTGTSPHARTALRGQGGT